jgi:hypothetical protein
VVDFNRESSFKPRLIQSELKTPYFIKIELCVFCLYFMLHVIFTYMSLMNVLAAI